jgi:transposase-like protein
MEHRHADPQPRCNACNADRKLVYGERVTTTYEMLSYRCPICRSEMRVVELSKRPIKSGSRFH